MIMRAARAFMPNLFAVREYASPMREPGNAAGIWAETSIKRRRGTFVLCAKNDATDATAAPVIDAAAANKKEFLSALS